MHHGEVVEQMTVERYLLGELDADARDDFEEHMFSCQECALDTRVAALFIDEAKAELGQMAPVRPGLKGDSRQEKTRGRWFSLWRPAFAAPVFAALAAVICFQNLVTLPGLRNAAGRPAVIPVAPLSGATRGETSATVIADRAHGLSVPIDIPLDPALGAFVSYSFEIHDPQGKLAWATAIPAPARKSAGDFELSLVLPGEMLRDGVYSVSISGTGTHGDSTPIEHYSFNIAVTK